MHRRHCQSTSNHIALVMVTYGYQAIGLMMIMKKIITGCRAHGRCRRSMGIYGLPVIGDLMKETLAGMKDTGLRRWVITVELTMAMDMGAGATVVENGMVIHFTIIRPLTASIETRFITRI